MCVFLEEGGFGVFIDIFENLDGLKQLFGIVVQWLMVDGYGFGVEGDWKMVVLLCSMKVMVQGLEGGIFFMEDYIYYFMLEWFYVFGFYMLEICFLIVNEQFFCEVYLLGIGGKEDLVCLVFDGKFGLAFNVFLVDMGICFCLIVNEVESFFFQEDLFNLLVVRVLWDVKFNLEVVVMVWILVGGVYYMVYMQVFIIEYLEDFVDMVGIELLVIDEVIRVCLFKDQLNVNEVYYYFFQYRF